MSQATPISRRGGAALAGPLFTPLTLIAAFACTETMTLASLSPSSRWSVRSRRST
ncbi:hypothetical protein [Burkholderia ubonensis]|nr:hypothetical protein [Burkholderia ubonensis]